MSFIIKEQDIINRTNSNYNLRIAAVAVCGVLLSAALVVGAIYIGPPLANSGYTVASIASPIVLYASAAATLAFTIWKGHRLKEEQKAVINASHPDILPDIFPDILDTTNSIETFIAARRPPQPCPRGFGSAGIPLFRA